MIKKIAYYFLLILLLNLLKWSIIGIKGKIIDIILGKIVNRFATIVDLYNFVDILKAKFLYIININYKSIISITKEEVNKHV